MSNLLCLNCGSSEMDKPLLTLRFREKDFYICPQCLPVLIHKPQELAEKLSGLQPWGTPENHDQ